MSEPPIDAGSVVRAVMDAYPETVAVFVKRRMHCPGCSMAPFMTLAEAADSYWIPPGELVDDLRAAISLSESGDTA